MGNLGKQKYMKWLGMLFFITMMLFFFSDPALASRADDLVGTWPGLGLWMRHSILGEYFQLNVKDATMLAPGDFNGDGIEDMVGYWPYLGDEGLWVRWGGKNPQKRWENIEIPPPIAIGGLISLTAGDMNGDGKDNIVGSGVGSVFYRSEPETWVPLLAEPAMQMATGDFNGDGYIDLVARVYNVNYKIWDGKTKGIITNIKYPEDFPPGTGLIISLGTGDMDNDCFCDILFAWDAQKKSPNGDVWYLDGTTIQTGNYTYVPLETGKENAELVTSGDIDGDGKDDLIGVWNSAGVWVRYYRTENWEKLHNDPASCITAVCFDENW